MDRFSFSYRRPSQPHHLVPAATPQPPSAVHLVVPCRPHLYSYEVGDTEREVSEPTLDTKRKCLQFDNDTLRYVQDRREAERISTFFTVCTLRDKHTPGAIHQVYSIEYFRK